MTTDAELRNARLFPDAGAYDASELVDDLGEAKASLLEVKCPICPGWHRPLVSKYTVSFGLRWRWVGISHRQPEVDYTAKCLRSGRYYKFTTYLPQ